REPWKSADVTGFGYMAELARGASDWLQPQLLGQDPEVQALLPYWLGAWALQAAPSWLAPEFAVRLPFMALLALTLAATWYGVYYLVRSPLAQPVSFAFGGEANPTDYARAIADGALLALIACLGLAQLSHETTPALAQLGFSALAFFGLAAMPYRALAASSTLAIGLTGLGLSGAATLALLLGLGGALVEALDPDTPRPNSRLRHPAWLIVGIALLAALAAWSAGMWRWRVVFPEPTWAEWRSLARLWLWFSWPAWPLALWTLWRWRRQRTSRHVALPLLFALLGCGVSLGMEGTDRALLLTLPAIAALAAFSLPTLSRSLSALIDWFTLLFFSGSALAIWVVWISMQVGVPAQPAANVQRLYPGFVPSFSLLPFAIALLSTFFWIWLVRWRTSRQRAAIWKSLVLPAGGVALSLLLLMTLWLPLGDYTRSYAPMVSRVSALIQPTGCVQVHGLTRALVAALRYQGQLDLRSAAAAAQCDWLLVDDDALANLGQTVNLSQWRLASTVRRPTDRADMVLLFRRQPLPRAP
ncbi:MAG: hypothetical protein WCH44_11340, partial [Betaproteobacteria bacterium]